MKAAVILLMAMLPAQASAETVYRFVENGVTTFSDTPPEDGAVEMLEIDFPPAADDEVLAARLLQMRETTARMAADRRAREKQRAELRALRSPTPAAAVPAVEKPMTALVGGYWPGYRLWRPPHRPPIAYPDPRWARPLPPAARRAPSGWSVMQPGNAQLMRPIVSSRD